MVLVLFNFDTHFMKHHFHDKLKIVHQNLDIRKYNNELD